MPPSARFPLTAAPAGHQRRRRPLPLSRLTRRNCGNQCEPAAPPPPPLAQVPLCGKSVDLPYLAKRGHETVGVEGVEAAVWALQRENWLDFTRVLVPRGGGGGGAPPQHDSGDFLPADAFGGARKGYVFTRGAHGQGYYRDAPPLLAAVERRLPLRVVVGDFLEVTPAEIGTFDAAWDRGSLVALPPGARARYAATLAALLRDGARVLLVTSHFDQSVRPGPPFVVSHAELEALYGPLGFTVELLSSRDASAEYKGGPWDAVSSIVENCYLLTKRGRAAQRRWYKPWSWFRG
ncbi:S-adenosyl-L-methionine-dependent methyltransferase [Tribonema minus]|uniref:S-adenosyl-L-methionine-dependent methyltransferase n=1 Tax=Tribonema minus TaxID=303371 RepID=A0A835ZBL3_9STRA|nr:S-adenosyl-L-methionine-dependent methyltransferase [Tribonema minus]